MSSKSSSESSKLYYTYLFSKLLMLHTAYFKYFLNVLSIIAKEILVRQKEKTTTTVSLSKFAKKKKKKKILTRQNYL